MSRFHGVFLLCFSTQWMEPLPLVWKKKKGKRIFVFVFVEGGGERGGGRGEDGRNTACACLFGLK